MKRRPEVLLPTGDQGDVTKEITGFDARMDEAEVGDAGSGADWYGADMTGGYPEPIQDEPDLPEDILPDRIENFPGQPVTEDREITAQPREPMPIDPSEIS